MKTVLIVALKVNYNYMQVYHIIYLYIVNLIFIGVILVYDLRVQTVNP